MIVLGDKQQVVSGRSANHMEGSIGSNILIFASRATGKTDIAKLQTFFKEGVQKGQGWLESHPQFPPQLPIIRKGIQTQRE
jgi:hypothetical protein